MPSDLGRNWVLLWLDTFMQTHPKVDLRLHVSDGHVADGHVDLYGQQIDLALRYGSPKDSSLIALPIVLDNRTVLCAAPEYLEKFGESKTPQDLTEHNCLCLGHNDKYFSQWTFERSGKQASVSVSGNRRSKDGDVIRRWAIIGHGLALKSRLDVISDIKEGRLIEIKLDGWQVAPYPLYLICPERRLIDPLFNAVKEYLIDCVEHISV